MVVKNTHNRGKWPTRKVDVTKHHKPRKERRPKKLGPDIHALLVKMLEAQAGADPLDIWTTKEGFDVQITGMTDLHLLHTYAMILQSVRQKVRGLAGEQRDLIVTMMQERGIGVLEAMAIEGTRSFAAIRKEAYHRGLIGNVPLSF